MTDFFPALRIRRDALIPEGPFAETQARLLAPNPAAVAELDALLKERQVGVVAHFYMDPELQGVLAACTAPHIRVSDSLLMADQAVHMARAGAKAIVVLGVDFMSENVRAVLDAAGHGAVPVYRVASEPIGCSLAESAEQDAYRDWLTTLAERPRPLHVVYINTSLATKATAQSLVPTITCTSSNVVKTILQAAHQVDEVHIGYGPDTYMGRNLEKLFRALSDLGDDAIQKVHPNHNRASLEKLLSRYQYFEQGVCVVHHLFGAEVAAQIRESYPDAAVAAHLEVPGAMFSLALERSGEGAGVVGSTSNILSFVEEKAREVPDGGTVSVVLGTEAGMITSIVRSVQQLLRTRGSDATVEIIFPVAAEAVATTDDPALAFVPGIQGGEGCSVEGGCATCPYMKMNSLEALLRVVKEVKRPERLEAFLPKRNLDLIDGKPILEAGSESILAMRHFQAHGSLPATLTTRVLEH